MSGRVLDWNQDDSVILREIRMIWSKHHVPGDNTVWSPKYGINASNLTEGWIHNSVDNSDKFMQLPPDVGGIERAMRLRTSIRSALMSMMGANQLHFLAQDPGYFVADGASERFTPYAPPPVAEVMTEEGQRIEVVVDTHARWRSFHNAFSTRLYLSAQRTTGGEVSSRTTMSVIEECRKRSPSLQGHVPLAVYILESLWRAYAQLHEGQDSVREEYVIKEMEKLKLKLPTSAGQRGNCVRELLKEVLDWADFYAVVRGGVELDEARLFNIFKDAILRSTKGDTAIADLVYDAAGGRLPFSKYARYVTFTSTGHEDKIVSLHDCLIAHFSDLNSRFSDSHLGEMLREPGWSGGDSNEQLDISKSEEGVSPDSKKHKKQTRRAYKDLTGQALTDELLHTILAIEKKEGVCWGCGKPGHMLRRCPNKKADKDKGSNTSDKDPPDDANKSKSDKLTRDKFGLLTKVGGWTPKNECDKRIDDNCGYCNREHELKDCKPYEVHLSKGFIDEQGSPTELFKEQLENERVDEWGFTVKQKKTQDSIDQAHSAGANHGEPRAQRDGKQPAPQEQQKPSKSIQTVGAYVEDDGAENGAFEKDELGRMNVEAFEAWEQDGKLVGGRRDSRNRGTQRPAAQPQRPSSYYGRPMSTSAHQIL